MSLYEIVQKCIAKHQQKNTNVLICQQIESDSTDNNKKIAITHEVPVGENIAPGDSLYFEKGANKTLMTLVMQPTGMDPVKTEMIYVHEADMYVGQRDIAEINYQLTLRHFETGPTEYLLQINYHKSDDVDDHQASHDGTIHPLP